jgi:hypothetical protein
MNKKATYKMETPGTSKIFILTKNLTIDGNAWFSTKKNPHLSNRHNKRIQKNESFPSSKAPIKFQFHNSKKAQRLKCNETLQCIVTASKV